MIDDGVDDGPVPDGVPALGGGTGTVAEWLDGLLAGVRVGPKAARVRQVLTTQPAFCSYATAAEVASRAGVNRATVIRFAQSVGHSGWPRFQAGLRAVYLARRSGPGRSPAAGGGLLAASFARDAQNLRELERSFDFEAARTVVRAVRAARRTVVVASGTHAVAANALAMEGAAHGFPIVYEDRGGPHLANALAGLGAGDCVVAWSFWRHYRQTVAALRVARAAGAVTCVITDTRHSPPAREAAHVLVVPTEGVASVQSMTVATSVAYGLLAELTATGPARDRPAAERTLEVWSELELFTEDNQGWDGARGTAPGGR
ncbi:MurR/RpiR family transcriptional regulator [Streptomyces sp. NPDC004609]|uniref:MurR/RpiR family transcriptional regulator n=1 Tax=Streptomyces sp. NPDC004609 TaxID=3364704 RepID=UPI00369978AB